MSHAGGEARAIDVLGKEDVLVLWLSPAELRDFSSKTRPPDHGLIVFSGELGGLDDAPLEAMWRRRAQMLYPYEQADRRSGRFVLNANSWLSRHGLVPQPGLLRLQGNTYSAREIRHGPCRSCAAGNHPTTSLS